MDQAKFVHLHLHTEYSLLDGANKVNNLIEMYQGDEQAGGGDDRSWQHVRRHRVLPRGEGGGIKPIMGCEIYVAPKSRFEKKGIDKGPKEDNNHLICWR